MSMTIDEQAVMKGPAAARGESSARPFAVGEKHLAELIRGVVARFPEHLRGQVQEADRFAFHVNLIASRKGTHARVCDVGSGWGTFALGCAAAGMDVVMVDDLGDHGFFDTETLAAMRKLYAEYGVELHSRDVVVDGLGFAAESFDAITSFDCFEHLHHSPKRLVAQIRSALRPQGIFILGLPNCVNLRKRLTVPFGVGKWSPMAEWYENDVFRGHVREPDVDDLLYIARDMKLTDVQVYGRNWMGYISRFALVRTFTPFIDRLLRLRPTLCSDIYVVGTKSYDNN